MNEYELIRKRENSLPEKTYEITDTDERPVTTSVLIVEDDATFAALLKEGLEVEGHLVTVASNGAEGLKKILAGDFNVIVCDMVMPNFPGDMFYLAVERVRPNLCKRFIFMTGHKGDRKIDLFIRQIRGLMLWKPFEMHALFNAIKALNTRK